MDRIRCHYRLACLLLLFAAGKQVQAAPAAPDPLLAAIPGNALLVALADLRPDSPSAKALQGMQTPEQAAVIRAGLHLALQQLATALLAPGAQLEQDVLPWLSRRAALCLAPAGPAVGGQVLLIETVGGTAAGAGFERLMQTAVQAGRLVPRDPIAGVPAWQSVRPPQGFVLAHHGSLLVAGAPEPAVTAVLTHLRAEPAPALAPVATALGHTPEGVFRLATVLPAPAQQGAAGPKGLTALALSARLEAEALVAEGTFFLAEEQRAALAALKPTFGESVAGIPDSAAAVLVAARPGPFFHTLGLPIAEAIGQRVLGDQVLQPLGAVLAMVFSDLLNQEVAFALLPSPDHTSWLITMTAARPDTLLPRVQQLVQAGQGHQGLTWTATPVGDVPAWSVSWAWPGAGQGAAVAPPSTVHFAVADARLLLASDRPALEAGVATLGGQAKPVTAAEWYPKAEPPAEAAEWLACADARALARWVASFISQRARLSQPQVAQLAEALLVGVRTGTLQASPDANGIRAVLRVGIDPPKMASLGAAIPTAAGLALGVPALARARTAARSSVCTSNLKQLCLAAHMYAQDWNEQLPPAEGWVEKLQPYFKNAAILRCPVDPQPHPHSYALNKAVAQLPLAQIARPAETILFYETTLPNPSPCGGAGDLARHPGHHGRVVLGFCDGHVIQHVGDIPAHWWDPAAQ